MTTPRQPGWYDDPHDSSAQRYWDGNDWTPHRQRKPAARSAQPSVTAAPPQPNPPPPPVPPPLPTVPSSLPPPATAAYSPAAARAQPDPPPPPPASAPVPPPPPGYSGATAGQGTGSPHGSAPQAWAPPNPQTRRAGPQIASEGFGTVKDFAGKLPITAWLLFGGLVFAVIATFLPFATVSVNVFGMNVGSHEVSANGAARFVVFLLVAVAVALGWPSLSGSTVVVGRLIGLSVVVVLLAGLMVVWFNSVSSENSQGEGVVDVTPGFGLLVYGAAVVVIAAGVVRLWIRRSRTQTQTY